MRPSPTPNPCFMSGWTCDHFFLGSYHCVVPSIVASQEGRHMDLFCLGSWPVPGMSWNNTNQIITVSSMCLKEILCEEPLASSKTEPLLGRPNSLGHSLISLRGQGWQAGPWRDRRRRAHSESSGIMCNSVTPARADLYRDEPCTGGCGRGPLCSHCLEGSGPSPIAPAVRFPSPTIFCRV